MITRLFQTLLWITVGYCNAAAGAGVVAERLDSIRLGFQQPSAVAVGEADRLYLLDGVSRTVWVLSVTGELVERLTVIPENRPTAHLPTDLALSDSHLYVADPGGERIRPRGPRARSAADGVGAGTGLQRGRSHWIRRRVAQ